MLFGETASSEPHKEVLNHNFNVNIYETLLLRNRRLAKCKCLLEVMVGVVGVEPTCVSRRVTVSSLTIREHTQKRYQQ